jgi:thioredoxin reductase (NADPH)
LDQPQISSIEASARALLHGRYDDAFPFLTDAEIARLRPFGAPRRFAEGDALLETGRPSPGMFVILSGEVLVTARTGVCPRVTPIVELHAGQFTAEISTIGKSSPALVDAHARAPVESLLVPPESLRRVLIVEPDVGERIMRAFVLRRSALIERGDVGPLLVGFAGSSDVLRLQRFLARIGTPHHLLDPSDPVAAKVMASFVPAQSGLPLVVCQNGRHLSNPTEEELGRELGLLGSASYLDLYDVAIVGTGPAGLSTAVYAASEGLSVTCGEHDRVRARSIVIATGARYRRPAIQDLAAFEGRGVWYWASPFEAKLCDGREVIVVGGGNSAGQAAVYLAGRAAKVTMMIRGAVLAASMSRYLMDRIAATKNIELKLRTEISALEGTRENGLQRVRWRTEVAPETASDVAHVFIFTGAEPATAWLARSAVALDRNGFVNTGAGATPLQSTLPGVFAVGDVRAGSVKRVGGAIGEGAQVVPALHAFLSRRGAAARAA